MDESGLGARFPRGRREISLLHVVQTDSGSHPGEISSEIIWPGLEADHSPPSGPHVKNVWNCSLPPLPHNFHSVVLN
jgi:hypothetical protein